MANAFLNIIVQIKDSAAAGLDRLKSAAGGVLDKIVSLKGALLSLVSGAVVSGLMNLLHAFGDQEEAIIKLNAALRSTGRFTGEGSKAIQDMATQLQHMTTVSDEALVGASATIAQFTRSLSTDQLAQVQKAIVGIAQVSGKDIGSVALQVAKGLAGVSGGLKKMGVDLSGAHTEQERFNLLMGKTAGFFDVAVQSADSLNGRLEQAHNAWHDLKETLGQTLANVVGLQGPNNDLRDGIERGNESLKSNMGTWVKWGKVLVDIAKVIITSLLAAFKIAFQIGTQIGAGITIASSSIAIALETIINKVIIAGLNDLLQKVDDFLGLFGKHLKFRIGEISTQSENDQITIALDQYRDAADGIDDALADVRRQWAGLVGDIKKSPLPPSAFAVTKGAGGPVTPPGETGDATADAKKAMQALAAELGNLTPLYKDHLITLDQYIARLQAATVELNRLRAGGHLTGTEIDDLQIKLQKAHEGLAEIGRAPEDGGILTFWQRVDEALNGSTDKAQAFSQVIANITTQFADDFGNAIESAFEALVTGSDNAANAFKKGMLLAIAAVAEGLAKMYIGRAVAEVAAALANPATAGTHLAAAAKFTAAAALLFAAAGAAKGGASGGGGSAGGGAGGGSSRAATVGGAADKGDVTINIQGGLINTADPDQMDQLAHAIEQLSDKRVTIKQGS